ncbi:competence type IV pilus major pilin ComGC [Pontibacillus sp. HMF3514]|uniref:competence type IV pilus major pilin ComGC n=1 Tax=Pontibacillus sp. HMF3514 TaxID=2692425 RepID=UPI00131F99F7|nr:competence type IV pilus major pilin ComGC [Pontibacillus sp. HMF3514]QHE52947.1 prepilin-type N-terminal cleavage/methylation domain-containing protein [Pontibacillus sp. HMF3514]
MKNEKGFTLVEMLIVLMIISTLLLITIPNIASNNNLVQEKGCDALIKLAETQAQAYRIENESLPTDLQTLVDDNFLEQSTCPGGDQLEILQDGTVQKVVVSP